MINYILFGLICASFIFTAVSALFFWKEKEFEDKRLRGGVNSIFFGLIFFSLFLLLKSTEYGLMLFSKWSIPYGYIIEIATVSLMMVCFLASMIMLREI